MRAALPALALAAVLAAAFVAMSCATKDVSIGSPTYPRSP
jgi:hypothetical protein